ncbi:MAG: hypothetical protein ACRC5M_02565 [Anaeroplasmataceae bacterium]
MSKYMICEYCKHGEVKNTYGETVAWCNRKDKSCRYNDTCNNYKENTKKIKKEESDKVMMDWLNHRG